MNESARIGFDERRLGGLAASAKEAPDVIEERRLLSGAKQQFTLHQLSKPLHDVLGGHAHPLNRWHVSR